jgi:hypothetical protein
MEFKRKRKRKFIGWSWLIIWRGRRGRRRRRLGWRRLWRVIFKFRRRKR